MSPIGNEKISVSDLVVKRLYYQYQAFVVPLITIAACLLLFWLVVLGQIQSWFAMKDAITTNAQDLAVMHQNLTMVTQLNDQQLDLTLQTATKALPAEKDFAGIIDSLQTAASIAGTSLDDYTFQLGDLSGLDQQGKASQLPVQLNVMLRGGAVEAQRFIHQLKNQLPLADATSVAVNLNTSVTVTVIFYYAQLPKITFVNTNPLPVLGADDQKLLNSLSSIGTIGNITLATPSARPSPTLTPTVTPSPTLTPTLTTTPTPTSTSSAR